MKPLHAPTALGRVVVVDVCLGRISAERISVQDLSTYSLSTGLDQDMTVVLGRGPDAEYGLVRLGVRRWANQEKKEKENAAGYRGEGRQVLPSQGEDEG